MATSGKRFTSSVERRERPRPGPFHTAYTVKSQSAGRCTKSVSRHGTSSDSFELTTVTARLGRSEPVLGFAGSTHCGCVALLTVQLLPLTPGHNSRGKHSCRARNEPRRLTAAIYTRSRTWLQLAITHPRQEPNSPCETRFSDSKSEATYNNIHFRSTRGPIHKKRGVLCFRPGPPPIDRVVKARI